MSHNPTAILDKALHHLGRSGSPMTFVQIGAMDGVTFDEASHYIAMYGWTGLYVEPVPSVFAQLVKNKRDQGHTFEPSAIVETDGPVDMLVIDPAAIEAQEVHPCFAGMSAVYPPRNGLASEGDRPVVEQFGRRIVVNGMTLETLFRRHNIAAFDLLLIDTEGHDWVVFQQLDLVRYRPKVIRLEWINLSEEDQAAVAQKLTGHGYVIEVAGQNIDAVLTSLWNSIPAVDVRASTRGQLAACLTAATGRTSSAALSRALVGADWDVLLHAAHRERIAPLVSLALRDQPTVPPHVRRALRDSRRRTAVRVAQLRRALETALKVLEAAGVPVILLKGAALDCEVWTTPGLRPWSDVDIFVNRHQVADVVHLLKGLGFHPSRMETTVGATVAHESELQLIGPGGVILDLHWFLFDSPHYQSLSEGTATTLWGRTRAIDVGGHFARILLPEFQLLHLSGHLVLHHEGDELLWLNDIAELVQRHHAQIDWAVVEAEAQSLDLVIALQRSLTAAADTLAAPVPQPVLARIRALRPSPSELAIVGRLTDRRRSMAARLWLDLTTMGTWSDRLAFARTRLFPSVTYMKARYQVSHPVLVALSYPYRWLIGFRRDSVGPEGDV